MNNDSYEKAFINSIKQTEQQTPSLQPKSKTVTNTPTLLLIMAITLAAIVLIESIALTIFAVNYGEVLDLYGGHESENSETAANDSPEALSENGDFNYDEDYNVTAFNLTCTNEDKSKYIFNKNGEYQKTDASSNPTESGTYSIINSSAIVLKNPKQTENKIVYYDGYDVIEDITFYDCGR